MDISRYMRFPYERGACGPNSFDCWGIVVDVYRQLGINVSPHPKSLSDFAVMKEIVKQSKTGTWIEVEKPQIFDVALMARKGQPFHVGIWYQGHILHALSEEMGILVTPLQDIQYPLNLEIKKYYRHRDLFSNSI